MSGCGSSDDSSVSGDSASKSDLGTPSQITTKVEAKKAFAASSQMSLGSNNNKSAQRVATFIQKSSAKKSSDSSFCDSGSIDYNVDDMSENGTITYNDCAFDEFTISGTITITDGAETGTYNYTDKSGNSASLELSVANSMQYISLNGKLAFDKNSTITYNDLKFGETLKYDFGYYTYDCTTDLNGNETCGQEYYVAAKDPHEESIDGAIKINTTTPERSCFNGTYVYTTEENMQFVPGKDTADSGKLDINGVKFEFNGDDTATVTYTDGSTDIVNLNEEVKCN